MQFFTSGKIVSCDLHVADLSGRRRGLHPDAHASPLLPGLGGLRGALLQEEGRSNERKRHGDGQDGGNCHHSIAPQVGKGLLDGVTQVHAH